MGWRDQILKAVAYYQDKYNRPILYKYFEALGIKKGKLKKMVNEGLLEEVYITTGKGYLLSFATPDFIKLRKEEFKDVPKSNKR